MLSPPCAEIISCFDPDISRVAKRLLFRHPPFVVTEKETPLGQVNLLLDSSAEAKFEHKKKVVNAAAANNFFIMHRLISSTLSHNFTGKYIFRAIQDENAVNSTSYGAISVLCSGCIPSWFMKKVQCDVIKNQFNDLQAKAAKEGGDVWR